MWASYKIGLDVLNDRLNRNEDGTPKNEKINELLATREQGLRKWQDLFQAKRLLVPMMPLEMIRAETIHCLAQARRWDIAEADEYCAELAKNDSPATQVAVYEQLLDSLHYQHYRRRLQDDTRRETAFSLNLFGVFIVLVTVLSLLVLTLTENLELLAHHSFLLVMWFGMLGAYLSRMIAFQGAFRQMEQSVLRIDFSLLALGVRLIVGALAALIFYLLILGDLVGGEFFPELDSQPFLVDRNAFLSPVISNQEQTGLVVGPVTAIETATVVDDGEKAEPGPEDPVTAPVLQSEDAPVVPPQDSPEELPEIGPVESSEDAPVVSSGGHPEIPEPGSDIDQILPGEDKQQEAEAGKFFLFSTAFAKLLIWATLAGFSERLLPDRLHRVTRGGSDDDSPDRLRNGTETL